MANWAQIVSVAHSFPGVQTSISYGDPSLKVGRSLLTRLREADQSIVLLDIVPDERDMLIQIEPDVFFVERHYREYPIVLARLEKTDVARLAVYIERRWLNIAGKALRSLYKASHRDQ